MTNQDRVPVFELHIRPMFRVLDREHMAKWVELLDLWDVDAVWQRRKKILIKVRDVQDMPGTRYGGPWPPEWVQIFERWMATGSDTEPGHHLVLATAQGDYQIESLGDGKRRLSVKVSAPTAGCRTWLELESLNGTERVYTLYLEPAYPKEDPQPTTIDAREVFRKGSSTIIVIHDAAGRHEIGLT